MSREECKMEEGAGRSGSLFLFSKDRVRRERERERERERVWVYDAIFSKRFLLKTVPKDEALTLRDILPHYHKVNLSPCPSMFPSLSF